MQRAQNGMNRHDIEVALGCLERAVHAGTSDAEVLASIHAWRRKAGRRLVREVCETYFGQAAKRADSVVYVRDPKLQADNIALKAELANWRREAVKWHQEYQRVFGLLTPKETQRLYRKVGRREGRKTDRPLRPLYRVRLLSSAFAVARPAWFAAACCAGFLLLFLAAKWVLLRAAPMH